MHKTELPVMIFDGDDTLWETMPLYRVAKRQFFVAMKSQGFDPKTVETEFEQRDVRNVDRLGFSKRRFRTSMFETYRSFCARAHLSRSKLFENRIKRIADSVFLAKPRVMPFARETLRHLKPHCRLILLTKGEVSIQKQRIRASGLGRYFDEVVIVPRKDTKSFTSLVRKYKLRRRSTWSVGNSLRSDIHPAIRAGLRAIWVPRQTWGYEEDKHIPSDAVKEISSLKEIPEVLLNSKDKR